MQYWSIERRKLGKMCRHLLIEMSEIDKEIKWLKKMKVSFSEHSFALEHRIIESIIMFIVEFISLDTNYRKVIESETKH